MLDKVKTALRILTTELDEELQDMINACKLDLELTGIVNIDEADPLIIRAAILYAKANFGFSADVNKFQSAYDVPEMLLAALGKLQDKRGDGNV